MRTPRTACAIVFSLIGISACHQDTDPKPGKIEPKPVATRTPPVFIATGDALVPAKADADKNGDMRNVRPEQAFRPDDRRTKHDEARFAEFGVRVFESKRLRLYTDITPDIAKTLPGLIDQLYTALENYFGPLPPDRAGTEFQISGYLMRDTALFRELGLLPDELFIEHGRHRNNEFWMRDQGYDYYRRHLLIHEATHCFMTFVNGMVAPVWYMEGMAELFGSHRFDNQGHATFRVMPTSPGEFTGFDRITTIREDVLANKVRTIAEVFEFQPKDFLTVRHYAWSWALCAFLDGTPHYHERFRKLGGSIHGDQFLRLFHESFDADQSDMATEWKLFCSNFQYGYDTSRAAITFQTGLPLAADVTVKTIKIAADHGWQSSGIKLEQGSKYQITATGQFTLADQPKPWISEPQGISFRYFNGRPLGMLLGCVRTDEKPESDSSETMLNSYALGRDCEFEAPATGTLYLRLNDAWDSLNDNHGDVNITIRRTP